MLSRPAEGSCFCLATVSVFSLCPGAARPKCKRSRLLSPSLSRQRARRYLSTLPSDCCCLSSRQRVRYCMPLFQALTSPCAYIYVSCHKESLLHASLCFQTYLNIINIIIDVKNMTRAHYPPHGALLIASPSPQSFQQPDALFLSRLNS